MCDVTTTGPAAIPCTRTDDHQPGRGCRFDAGDVPDGRHDDNRSDQ